MHQQLVAATSALNSDLHALGSSGGRMSHGTNVGAASCSPDDFILDYSI
jgi:hypothetical protein